MHDVMTVGVPVVAILFGILLNQQVLRELKAQINSEIGSLCSEMNTRFARIDRIQADLQQFDRTLGEPDKAIEIL